MSVRDDKQVISAARNLVTEYIGLLEIVAKELTAEADAEPVTGATSFDYARKSINKEARKAAYRDFINRIKSYGNQRLE